MKTNITLCLIVILLSATNAFAQPTRKARRLTPQSKTSRPTDFDKFIGIWEFSPKYAIGKGYFKITEEQPRTFKFIEGFEYQGNITWAATAVNDADGIYLKPLNGRLVGRFTSSNFRATHSYEITYRISLSLKPDGNLLYSVSSGLGPESYVAISHARATTSAPKTYVIVTTGENAPEAIIRVISTTTITPGKHKVIVAGGPCRSQSRARFVHIIDTEETLAEGDLFFVVPVDELGSGSGWALRRADSREAAQYESCRWR